MNSFMEKESFFKDKDLTYCVDRLTGVLTRETVLDYINYLIKTKRPFSYLICDIDNFKYVNDSLGHTVGDIVLQKGCNYLVELTNDEGVVGRFGGDEFMVIVPDVIEYEDIWKVSRKIIFETNHLEIGELNGNNISFTVGLSRYPLDGEVYETLMEKADKALYRGKQKGRNCFIIYLDEKHANINITDSGAKAFNTMDMHAKVGKILTNSDDLKENMSNLISLLSNNLMIDHLCIQSKNDIICSSIHSLSKSKEFKFIDNEIMSAFTNASGLCYMNNIEVLNDLNRKDVFDLFAEQKVTSTVFVRIEAYNNYYGYVRADSTNPDGRIWQVDDLNLLIMFARMLGVILHLKGIELDEV